MQLVVTIPRPSFHLSLRSHIQAFPFSLRSHTQGFPFLFLGDLEEVRQRHVTFMNILISLVLIHDSPYKIVHSVFLIDGLFRCKLQTFPESTTCENPV